MKKKIFGNVLLSIISEKNFLKTISKNIKTNSKVINVFFLNAHCFNVAQRDTEYRNIINAATFLLNDGIGIKLGSILKSIKITENLNGTDLTPKVLSLCEMEGFSVYLLGATEKNLKNAILNIKKSYPRLQIAGYHHGFFDLENEMIEKINATNSDVLIVGMGVPVQEKFIYRNDKVLNCKARIAVGAFIDFASGNISRAPLLIRKLKMEWIYRLLMEPRRMWKRYLIGNILFFYNLLKATRN